MKRNNLIRHLVLVSLVIFLNDTLLAQLRINFNAPVYGKSIEGLSMVQLTNNYASPKVANFTIRVNEAGEGNVLTILIPQVYVPTGSQTIARYDYSNAKFSFSNTGIGKRLSVTGRFPDGDYEYCFEVELFEPKSIVALDYVDQCFSTLVQQMTPILLIDPAPEDIICNTRPTLSWQPPMPMDPQILYRVILCEKRKDQADIEAISYNMPIINMPSIPSNRLMYPVTSPELRKGQEYVWQVTAYTGNTILMKSEIWIFSVQCDQDSVKPGTESYREIKEEAGGVFLANRYLKFGFTNPYSAGDLEYTIVSVSDNARALTKLPKLRMTSGLNKFNIDLSAIKSFKEGQEYLLTVKLPTGRLLKLRFIYNEKEI